MFLKFVRLNFLSFPCFSHLPNRYLKPSTQIGAWKFNFPPYGIMTDQPSNRPTDGPTGSQEGYTSNKVCKKYLNFSTVILKLYLWEHLYSRRYQYLVYLSVPTYIIHSCVFTYNVFLKSRIGFMRTFFLYKIEFIIYYYCEETLQNCLI